MTEYEELIPVYLVVYDTGDERITLHKTDNLEDAKTRRENARNMFNHPKNIKIQKRVCTYTEVK